MSRSSPLHSHGSPERTQTPLATYPAYSDHSNVSEEWIEQRRRDILPADGKVSGGAKKKFPIQLYHMLEAVDGTPHSLLVRWLPHGRSFMVFDTNRFAVEVLQLYFPSQSKFTSFQRQLNIYGFLRCTRVDDGYYHELFLRGRPALAALIPRPTHGQHTSRRTFDPTSEPNFYAMTWLPDVAVPMDGADSASGVDTANVADPSNLQRSYPPSSQMPRPMRSNPDIRVRRSTQSINDSDNSSQGNVTPSPYMPYIMPTDMVTNGVPAQHGRPFAHQLPTRLLPHVAPLPSQTQRNKRAMSSAAIVTDLDGSAHSMMQRDIDSDWMLPHHGNLPGSDSEDVDTATAATQAVHDASRRAPYHDAMACRVKDAEVEEETESDKVERNSTSSSEGNLDEWAEFLHDVDLD